jgi:GNAT superfamily N-acetyltransferase
MKIRIVEATTREQLDRAAELFKEYERGLGLELCFQGFEAELRLLPGEYARPDGRLLLAYVDEAAAGCVALKALGDGVCEMKRLYVREEYRGYGLGIKLIMSAIEEAKEVGYAAMRLDTFPPKMEKAVELYRSLGFVEVDAYYDDPNEGVLFMELKL